VRSEIAFKQALIDKLTHENAILKRLKFAAKSEAFSAEQKSLLDETLDRLADLAGTGRRDRAAAAAAQDGQATSSSPSAPRCRPPAAHRHPPRARDTPPAAAAAR
jgi:transposase